MRKREMTGDGGNHHEKLGIKRIACASQCTVPDTADTRPDPEFNNTHTMSSQPIEASHIPDCSYLLVSSTLFSSSSPISLVLVHHTIIIAQHEVRSSLYISPGQDPHLTPSTAYTEYSLHRVQNPPKVVHLQQQNENLTGSHTPTSRILR